MFARALILAVAVLVPALWTARAEDEKPNVLEGKVKEITAVADGFAGLPLDVLKRFGRWDGL